jgi:hypothetical protein
MVLDGNLQNDLSAKLAVTFPCSVRKCRAMPVTIYGSVHMINLLPNLTSSLAKLVCLDESDFERLMLIEIGDTQFARCDGLQQAENSIFLP